MSSYTPDIKVCLFRYRTPASGTKYRPQNPQGSSAAGYDFLGAAKSLAATLLPANKFGGVRNVLISHGEVSWVHHDALWEKNAMRLSGELSEERAVVPDDAQSTPQSGPPA